MNRMNAFIALLVAVTATPALAQSAPAQAPITVAGHPVTVQTQHSGAPVYNPQAGTVQGSTTTTSATIETGTKVKPVVTFTTNNPHPNQSPGETTVGAGLAISIP